MMRGVVAEEETPGFASAGHRRRGRAWRAGAEKPREARDSATRSAVLRVGSSRRCRWVALPRFVLDEVEDLLEGLILGGDAVGARLGRLKLATKTPGSRRRRWLTMSSRTRSVAVAVRAMSGDVGQEVGAGRSGGTAGGNTGPIARRMGFVDGEGGDVPGAEVFLPVVEHEALGGGVEEGKMAVA